MNAANRMKKALEGRKQILSLFGNWNFSAGISFLINTSPSAVYEKTKDLLEVFRNQGGLMLGASNAVVRETPWKIIDK